jgi:hypothetical protein
MSADGRSALLGTFPLQKKEITVIVVLSETPNMTSEQYDLVDTELGLSKSLPDGCRLHVAGPGPDGSTWRDVMVWDSPAEARQFMDTHLRPAVERAGASPVWGPPANWPVHKLITPPTGQ